MLYLNATGILSSLGPLLKSVLKLLLWRTKKLSVVRFGHLSVTSSQVSTPSM